MNRLLLSIIIAFGITAPASAKACYTMNELTSQLAINLLTHKSTKAWIETKRGRFDCELINYREGGINFKLSCDNNSTIVSYFNEYSAFVKDANNSEFKMKLGKEEFETTCYGDKVLLRETAIAFQKSFQFDVVIEYQYEKRKISPPLGF